MKILDILLLRRISIRTKIMIMIVGMSAVFGAGILGFVYYQLQNTLRDEALNKALILADGLSVKAAEPVQVEDLNALQFILGEAIGQADVAYAFIRDGRGRVLSSSFEGNVVPPELQNINQLQPNVPFGTENTNLVLKDTIIEVTDIASPVGGGALGSIHIGLNITQIKTNIRNILLKIIYVGAGSLLALSIITVILATIIIAPVRDLMRVAEALGSGDLSKKANVKSADELGQLGTTLNNTIDRLQGLVQTEADRDKMQHQVMDLLSIVSGAAEGDLTVKAEVTADALGSVADAFNLMINGLTALVSQASSVAHEIQSSTGDMLQASERMRRGAEQQTAQIQGASGAVNEMSHTIQRMAENAEAATQASLKATQAAVKGGSSVAETIKGMQRIRAAVQTTGKKIKGLGERSLEIGAIIEVINEIATQTNLLALNAAIEAARAGEQGKGFAVVADEVRKLAERAARATKDITSLIKGIQVETSEAVTVMEEGTREVEEGTKLADQAGAALREIEQIVKQTSGLVTDITNSAANQVKVSESVVSSMNSISKLTQDTTKGVQDTVETIGRLADLSKRLTDAIGRFKLGKEQAAPAGEGELPVLEGSYPQLAEDVTTSDEEIKLGFVE
ncbi:MAG: HAMP domain-containing protein [Nitrospirae bacterium]|nr:HAMP domain-containing protein [Nitrospirota bacterium]NTW64725.1 HAMP domain-containing protein [Nitrospirota bacterium]